MTVPDFFLVLVSIFAAAKLLGELAERIGQPAVLGEILAGVILGTSLLGLVDPADEIVHLLAELGVVLLLFEIGLETDLRRLLSVGASAFTVAFVGVVVPFASACSSRVRSAPTASRASSPEPRSPRPRSESPRACSRTWGA